MTVESTSEISISYLSEMLEGQVALLSSGYIKGAAALEVLNALKISPLFREDQYSYTLYPNKQLPRFVQKNSIPIAKVQNLKLVQELVKNGDLSIVVKDVHGMYHFNGSFNNAASLKTALEKLPTATYGALVEKDTEALLVIFEEVFNHKSFTGRSGLSLIHI